MLDVDSKSKVVNLTRELVRIESVTGNERRVAELIASFIGQHGLEVKTPIVEEGRLNVVAHAGRTDDVNLLLSGHTDTVPLGQGWSKDPTGGELRDGRIYGRGSCDMKAGLAAMLVGFLAACADRRQDALGICYAAVIDEEVSGKGTRHLAANGFQANAAIIAEPTELQVITAAKGNGYIDIAVMGQAAHAGSPGSGANAISLASRIVALIEEFDAGLASQTHPFLGKKFATVTRVGGGEGDSIVPSRCDLLIDVRTVPGVSTSDMLKDIERVLDKGLSPADRGRVTSGVRMNLPAMETSADHPVCAALVQARKESGAPDMPTGGWTAACDGGILQEAAGIATILYGPGSIVGQAHRPDEFVPVDELLIATETFQRVSATAFRQSLASRT